MLRLIALFLVMALPLRAEPLRVLAMGDSILAWHAWSGHDIPSVVAESINADVTNVAVSGAAFATRSGRNDIRSQFVAGSWDVVVINGGANDLAAGCGCGACMPYLNVLIDTNLNGLVPDFLAELSTSETEIIWMGYYATGFTGPFFGCRDALVEMERRIARLAGNTEGLRFVDAEDVIEPANRAHFFYDRVHPSRRGARLIGRYLAEFIAQ